MGVNKEKHPQESRTHLSRVRYCTIRICRKGHGNCFEKKVYLCPVLNLQKGELIMKKITTVLVLLLAMATQANAQLRQNEARLNILNVLAIASAEVGYERYIDDNQSLSIDLLLNDRFSYSTKKKFSATSLALGYNYYIGDEDNNQGSGIVISPFMKFRIGKLKESEAETKLNSFILGIGGGYKWVFNDVFTVNPFVNIARNFSSTVNNRFMAIEPNAGINIGYRF